MRLVSALILGMSLLAPRESAACSFVVDPVGPRRYLLESYTVGVAHGAGGALGEGVASDSIRYGETNGWLLDLMFGVPLRLLTKNAPKKIDCSAGACTYLDVTLWTPRFNAVAGGMYSAGVSFPFDRDRPEGPAIVQLGVAIGFFDDGRNRHARDAIVVAAAVPMTRRVHARMRADLNVYGAFDGTALDRFKRNSPISAGVTADVGSRLQLTADVERYDVLRGGLGWSLGAAARF